MTNTQEFAVKVNSRVLLVAHNTTMEQVVKTMNERDSSSVLVFDQSDKVCGIITERDIVRKFTLIDADDKLKRTVATVMTRPVQFVRIEHLRRDIKDLFLRYKIRHFPVIEGKNPPTVDHVVGIVSLSDIFRSQITQDGFPESVDTTAQTQLLAVLTCNIKAFLNYRQLLRNFHFEAVHITDFNQYVRDHPDQSWPVLFDLDGYREKQLRQMIPVTKKYQGPLAMTTSSPGLVQGMRRFLDHSHQIIALKPIDVTYVQWFFSQNDKSRSEHRPAG